MQEKLIAEFREWWSSRPNKNDVEANGIWALWMERLLRRHEAEHWEAKPTPPKDATAGLYEAVEGLLQKTTEFTEETTGETMPVIFPADVLSVLSRYRPATPSEGLVECPCDKCHEFKSCKSQCREYYEFEEIISRHTGGKGVI